MEEISPMRIFILIYNTYNVFDLANVQNWMQKYNFMTKKRSSLCVFYCI